LAAGVLAHKLRLLWRVLYDFDSKLRWVLCVSLTETTNVQSKALQCK